MAQMGHTSPTMTLGLYAQVMNVSDADKDRLRRLVQGVYLAVDGSRSDLTEAGSGNAELGRASKVGH
jgi:hypothetical protein